MNKNLRSQAWWGAPKTFSTEKIERRISWLELFYDLVYVIAISTITHYMSQQYSLSALLDYLYLFVIIYWGWLNGSLYHDLHGSEGLRTKLMTLWQMMIVAALVITLHSNSEKLLFNSTIVLLIMQIYITYLWWSVGIYDRAHRKLNKPYTIIYLVSFVIILATLFVEVRYVRLLFFATLILNCSPPFITYLILKRRNSALSLSESMTERLSQFTIIVFGEVVLGVINGIIEAQSLSLQTWIQFIFAISIVFSLWWLFFTIVSDRQCKPGLLNSSIFELLFIPVLIGLGILGASFSDLFKYFNHTGIESDWIKMGFGFSISIFLLGIWSMMCFLNYPVKFITFKRIASSALIVTAILIGLFMALPVQLSLTIQLLIVLIILIALIFYLNNLYYRKFQNEEKSLI